MGDLGALGRAGGGRQREGEGGRGKGKTGKSGVGAYPGAAAARAFQLQGRYRVGGYGVGSSRVAPG